MAYRRAVMLLLKDRHGRVLVAHKTGAPAHDWYFPSGGIQEGETPQQAFWRELGEELGFARAMVSEPRRASFTHRYNWGADLLAKTGYEGQEQAILVAEVRDGAHADLARTDELDAVRWVAISDLSGLVPHKDLLAAVRRVVDAGLL